MADLGVTELALDHPERMLHLRAHAGLEVFPTLFLSTLPLIADGLQRRGPDGDEECCLAGLQFFAFVRTGVAAVAKPAVFFAMQRVDPPVILSTPRKIDPSITRGLRAH